MSAVSFDREPLGDWALDAACLDLDPELFFPGRGERFGGGIDVTEETRRAKAVCATCPVIDDCLDHALRNHERFGVWGGTSPRERQGMRRRTQ